MTQITVQLGKHSYPILVQPGSLELAADYLEKFTRNRRFFVLTDENAGSHFLPKLHQAFAGSGIKVIEKILPAGEASKSWGQVESVTDWLLSQGIERSDILVALGGGVIGDLTGFAAAIVKRGLGFVQIPTSLLAQVDSSVGGKTAINSSVGKNLIGSFHQPLFVLIDPLVLNSLPDRELRAGYAEVIKYGLINDAEFFAWCEANGNKILNRDPEALSEAIIHSVQAKAQIVAEDEKELSGRRALLNLGHTFGHALEAETGFSNKLVHGEAVAAGMALAFKYSVRRGHCDTSDAQRVVAHLKAVNLPYDLATASVQASGQRLVDHMMHDKKMSGGTLPFLLANGIGQTFVANDVELDDVAAFLDESS
ncbi:3-dehydroquinate synthase [Parasphingorhabdus sp.]|uniref:3-dehydroquinate synthase n=1 Tax=Parasphingorhabdus sp. TaxID=2709688 RepID=UPI003A9448E1